MLMSAGWTVQDANAVNTYAKQGVAIREFELKSGYGTADYLLCNSMDLTPRSFL
jgi:type I restriction enzyme R subunit